MKWWIEQVVRIFWDRNCDEVNQVTKFGPKKSTHRIGG